MQQALVGLNADALRQLARNGTALVITVDCGVGSVSEAEEARTLAEQSAELAEKAGGTLVASGGASSRAVGSSAGASTRCMGSCTAIGADTAG